MRKITIVLGMIICLSSCTNNSLDDLQLVTTDDMEEPPMEVLVTYEDVSFIFSNTCIQCHSNPPQFGAPMPLTNYIEIRESILNNETLDRINRSEGANGLMPDGGPRLPQELIERVFQWNEDGLLEN